MAFFDEISKRMNGVAQTAQKTAEIARLQRQINSEENEFYELFAEIGKLYYNCRQRSVAPGETMDQLCDRVDALAQHIEQMKLKLDEIKQIRRCQSCGSVQNSASRFCANCGARLEERTPAPADEPVEPAAPAEEPAKSVYINWPGSSEAAQEAPQEAQEAPAEEPAQEQPQNPEDNEN